MDLGPNLTRRHQVDDAQLLLVVSTIVAVDDPTEFEIVYAQVAVAPARRMQLRKGGEVLCSQPAVPVPSTLCRSVTVAAGLPRWSFARKSITVSAPG